MVLRYARAKRARELRYKDLVIFGSYYIFLQYHTQPYFFGEKLHKPQNETTKYLHFFFREI